MKALHHSLVTAAIAMAAVASQPAQAQSRGKQQGTGTSPTVAILNAAPADQQPDVVLDIPNLSVESITLEVNGLQAHVALDAQLASLLHLTAGADARLDSVKLDIKGVQAQAALIVRLDNVKAIIDRTLQTLDNNPQIITQLTGTVDNAVNVTGGVVNNTVRTVGDLTQGVLRSGAVLDLARSGLSVVGETVNAAGETVRRLKGSDGVLYEVVTNTAGRILRSTRVGT
jgi:hypothetical protein